MHILLFECGGVDGAGEPRWCCGKKPSVNILGCELHRKLSGRSGSVTLNLMRSTGHEFRAQTIPCLHG